MGQAASRLVESKRDVRENLRIHRRAGNTTPAAADRPRQWHRTLRRLLAANFEIDAEDIKILQVARLH